MDASNLSFEGFDHGAERTEVGDAHVLNTLFCSGLELEKLR